MLQAHPALAAHALLQVLKCTIELYLLSLRHQYANRDNETISRHVGTVLRGCVTGELHQHILL